MKRRILLLPGDGIGPEVVREAKKVLEVVGERYALQLEFREANLGGAAIDAEGSAYPASTQAAAKEADAILLGAVGGPLGIATGAGLGKMVSDGTQWLFGDKKTPEQRKMELALAQLQGGLI